MAEAYGVKTTCPLGRSVAPQKELAGKLMIDDDTRALGSIILIDETEKYTIFPEGSRAAPQLDELIAVPVNVETARVVGLKEAMPLDGEKSITFPFGARTGDCRGFATMFEKTGGFDVVLYIQILLVPPMTTFPFGMRTPPIEPITPVDVKLEYSKDDGSSCPIFAHVFGMNTTFPFGARTPPPNPDAAVTFEYA